ncbi:EscI/YscI/HrpB family type III secretion system inner rod protein [Bradyrhizobium ottawaense]|uniref:EscI/YscI/HrpB family type III secretion system inner rod protein n=1 Tax=Bradyrhizobium ottawaense TaxID=931866 RepID=UPI00384AF105
MASKAPSDSVEAFRAALDRPVLSSPSNDLAGVASLAPTDEGLIGRVRVADDILSSMDKLGASFGDAANAAAGVAERFASGGFSSTEWLNVQSTLSAMTLQYDIASKVVGKAVQSLDSLLKSQ